ncbi:L,D-transpeptidase [Undibacter mobilis]|uniref:L,D-TPase catalytic domain-containing protein n=1 Tax=Undibacter mobilis TaxID=2292256 RepID=A0A371BBM0_9BRAD|nr:L,D-transpeptidase [Undibacter mobilis]RDV04986.1 hypothetical protein DXH78_10685 [Undibacter mobilis]
MRIRPASWLAALIAGCAMSVILSAFTAAPARADLLITVDKTSQRMTVEKDGEELFVWPVSTGAAGYDTPSGTFKPFRMEKDHFSREWDDAPMPHSIFFTMKGHAIHGSTHKSIGRPASHGCVRLEPKNAALLFDLVKQETMGKTRVVLTGEAPGVTAPAVARRNAPSRAADFEQSFSSDDVTASIEPRLTPPADIPRGYYAPPSYAPRDYAPRREYGQERRAVIGYRDTRTGQIYYYDRPRYEYAPPPRYYYGER